MIIKWKWGEPHSVRECKDYLKEKIATMYMGDYLSETYSDPTTIFVIAVKMMDEYDNLKLQIQEMEYASKKTK